MGEQVGGEERGGVLRRMRDYVDGTPIDGDPALMEEAVELIGMMEMACEKAIAVLGREKIGPEIELTTEQMERLEATLYLTHALAKLKGA